MRVSANFSDVLKAAAELKGASGRVRTAQRQAAFRFGARMVATAVRSYRSAAATTATSTARRTGNLARSIVHRVATDGRGVVLDFGYLRESVKGDALKYAGAQEYGATIRAKGGKYLAIPLKEAKTAKGVARGGPRDFENTFVIPSRRAGDKIIMQKRGPVQAVPLFLLTRRSIKIPARPALQPSADKHLSEFTEALREGSRAVVFGT